MSGGSWEDELCPRTHDVQRPRLEGCATRSRLLPGLLVDLPELVLMGRWSEAVLGRDAAAVLLLVLGSPRVVGELNLRFAHGWTVAQRAQIDSHVRVWSESGRAGRRSFWGE